MNPNDKSLNSIILKASSYMGAASSLNLIFGLIRVKVAAIFIGVGGVGLLTNYRVIQTFIGSVIGLGVRQSAVRDIAESISKKDENIVSETIISLRILVFFLGLIGALLIFLFSSKISFFMFSSYEYSVQIALLGFAVFFANLTGGQLALIQGMGETKKLALFNVISGFFNLILSTIFFIYYGMEGILPSIIGISVVEYLLAILILKKIPYKKCYLSLKSFIIRTKIMINLGFSFMITSLGASFLAILINSLITKEISLDSVGIYAAATALTAISINFILNAMSADFYPRLTSLINNNEKAIDLINKQTEIGICIVLPGLFATAALADFLVYLFYSQEFMAASIIMPLLVLACLPRIISWPLAYIMLAKAASKSIILTEIFLSVINFILVYLLIERIGIWAPVLGVLFVRLLHIAITYIIGKKLINFYWSQRLQTIIFISIISLAIYIGAIYLLPNEIKIVFGMLLSLIVLFLCIKNISNIVELSGIYRKLLAKIPFMNKSL